MRIKNKLLLSYLSVIVIIILIMAVIALHGMAVMEQRNLESARRGVERIVNDNFMLTRDVLTRAGEKFVIMKSESAALELKMILDREKPEEYLRNDYAAVKDNSEIRNVIDKPIMAHGKNPAVAGYLDLFDIHGTAVIHPNQNVEDRNYAEWKEKFPEMWKLVEKSFTHESVNGYYSFLDNHNRPVRKFMALRRISGTPVIVAAVVEINKYFLPIHDKIRESGEKSKYLTDREISISSEQTLTDFKNWGLLISSLLLIFGAVLALWQAGSTSKPIIELADKVRRIGKGDFSVTVPEKGSLEIKELAAAFNSLGRELTEYIENLKHETAAREAMESELKVAREIQESLLPHSFSSVSDKNEFALFATLLSAKDVSGDFYDFFFVTDSLLAIVVADVSGKGLPAAIFMAVSRTLIRNMCLDAEQRSPDKILTAANQFLCMDNDAAMFVTLFLAYYNTETGVLHYANAGHNPVLSIKPGTPPEEFGLLTDMPLGIIEDHSFSSAKYTLEKDEMIMLYTDGVTEATSPDGSFYGMERLIRILEENKKLPVNELIGVIEKDVSEYQSDHQFDDITMMILKREK